MSTYLARMWRRSGDAEPSTDTNPDIPEDVGGIGGSSSRDPSQGSRPAALIVGAVLAVLLAVHGLQAFRAFPYYALAFNPLAGGSRMAPYVLMIGWGEGLNEVGKWLARVPSVTCWLIFPVPGERP